MNLKAMRGNDRITPAAPQADREAGGKAHQSVIAGFAAATRPTSRLDILSGKSTDVGIRTSARRATFVFAIA
jgi:hypothetical protein